MEEKSIKRSIVFPAQTYKRLEETAARFDLPTSAIIKIACVEYLERQEKNIKE